MKAIKITILLLFLTGTIYAQNCCDIGDCYIRLGDILGVDSDKYQGITESNIQSEFIERDLYNASSFDEVQWRMRDTGLTKDGLKELLEKPNVRESIQDKLGADKVNALLKRDDLDNDYPEQISQALIDYFDNEENYKKIFKNVY